jgi:hypothetical protein
VTRGAFASLAWALLAASAHAEADRIAELERRVAQLEARAEAAEERARAAERSADGSATTEREERPFPLRLSGSTRLGWYDGQRDSALHDRGASIRDARLFLDAELAEDVRVGAFPLVRNVGFSFEWNVVRRSELFNDVGELFVDLQGIGGSSWLNLRPGRFQIPVGEAYKRYSRGEGSNPFISQSVGGPWWWDEGVMLYGASPAGLIGYAAALTNGETPLDFDDGDGEQLTLKLWAQPLPWLYLSASGLHQGEIGSGGGALWLGETWATPSGSMSAVPTWIDGAIAPPSFAPFDSAWLAGGDLVLTPLPHVRAWLGGGLYSLDARDPGPYDRAIHYWIAELVLGGAVLSPSLAPATLGLRADGIGTGDKGRGALLSIDLVGTLGYNQRSLRAYSAVLGWQLGAGTTLRAEYSLRDIELVRGAASALGAAADDANELGLELGVRF